MRDIWIPATITVLIAVALIFGITALDTPVHAQNYSQVQTGRIYASILNVTGLSTFKGGIRGDTATTYSLPADVAIAYTPYATTQTIASGGTIEPYRTNVMVTAAGAVSTDTTTAIADGYEDGQEVRITNTGTNVITVKNAANTALGGDIALGQYDVLACYWNETASVWVRLYNANN